MKHCRGFHVEVYGRFDMISCYIRNMHTSRDRYHSNPQVTYGVASLQLATPRAAALGVGSVIFLDRKDASCLGNRWRSLAEGRGWHQSRGESLTGNIHRLRLLLQSAEVKNNRQRTRYYGGANVIQL